MVLPLEISISSDRFSRKCLATTFPTLSFQLRLMIARKNKLSISPEVSPSRQQVSQQPNHLLLSLLQQRLLALLIPKLPGLRAHLPCPAASITHPLRFVRNASEPQLGSRLNKSSGTMVGMSRSLRTRVCHVDHRGFYPRGSW